MSTPRKPVAVEVLRVDGTREPATIQRETRLFLSDLYRIIGCDCIEPVRLADGRMMVVDESGILKNKPINPEATRLYHDKRDTFNPIVGDVVLMAMKDFR